MSISLGQPRKKRDATDRQTNERYSTVRRRCRNIRACGAQARSDVDVLSLNSTTNKEPEVEADPTGQPSEIHFTNGKQF